MHGTSQDCFLKQKRSLTISRNVFCVFSIALFRMRGSRSQANRKWPGVYFFSVLLRIRQRYIPSSVHSSSHLGHLCPLREDRHCMLGNAVPTSKAIKSGWHLYKPNNAGGNLRLGVRQELSVVLRRLDSGTSYPCSDPKSATNWMTLRVSGPQFFHL